MPPALPNHWHIIYPNYCLVLALYIYHCSEVVSAVVLVLVYVVVIYIVMYVVVPPRVYMCRV